MNLSYTNYTFLSFLQVKWRIRAAYPRTADQAGPRLRHSVAVQCLDHPDRSLDLYHRNLRLLQLHLSTGRT